MVFRIVGIILLIGIVKNNAMMIDFALQAARIKGKAPPEAIHQSCLLRFRPISGDRASCGERSLAPGMTAFLADRQFFGDGNSLHLAEDVQCP